MYSVCVQWNSAFLLNVFMLCQCSDLRMGVGGRDLGTEIARAEFGNFTPFGAAAERMKCFEEFFSKLDLKTVLNSWFLGGGLVPSDAVELSVWS